MKITIRILISLFVFVSCNTPTVNEPRTESSRRIQIRLVDSLGQVTLSVPTRYDTVFSWVNHSDCGKPCDEQEYRYQPKALAITKESGFFWRGEPKDSVDRFTLTHSSDIRYSVETTAMDSLRHKYLKLQIVNNSDNPEIIYDTIEKIADRYFSIFVMQRSDTIQNIRVLAVTTIKGNEVKFQYELLSKKGDLVEKSFIKNSLDLIHTIRINKRI
jgi:hypothetical protein